MQASRGGAFRGRGRGGFRGRGRPAGAGASGQQHHMDAELDADADCEDVEEAPEIALLRQTYTNSLNTIKSIFPQYTDEEILLTVQEANGQADVAIARIAEGYISTFTAAKPKQQQQSGRREQSFPAQAEQAPGSGFNNAGFAGQSRGAPRGAARGAFTGRGRGGDFRGGRGAARGGRGGFRPPTTNGHITAADTPEVSTTTTTIETTEADGWGEVTITQTTESADATEVVQTVETIVKEESTPQPAPVAAAPAAPAAKPASRVIQPGAKMSWAQIARPPPQAQPKPAPVAAPAPQEPEIIAQAPVEVVIVTETSPAAAEPTLDSTAITTADIVSALAGETAPLLDKEEATTVSQDPWAPAVPEATTPAALPVGEGWADAVAAAKDDAIDIQSVLQHQRAEAAVPPTGVDPAGPLDVHTPAPEALPTQQPAFDQSSALASETTRSQAVPSAVEKLVSPPGLAKRGSARVQQDAPVVISGSGATPSVDGVGVQFGSLSLFGNFDADQSATAPADPQQQATSPAVSQQIQLPGQQQQAHQGIQRSLYETPTSLEQQVQEALQPTHQSSFPASTTDHNQFGAYQQSQQQPFGQQSSCGQDRLSGLGGYGGQYQQQQASSIPSQTSAYASRYPQQQQQSAFGQQAQQGQGQQQQAHDPFASLTSNANASAYGQQAGGLGNDSISPYYSSAQHNMSLGHQSAPSPAPASTRDIGSLGSQAAPGANSAYGGFTSAIGQAQQQQYPNDYASLYGLPQQQQQQQQEPARALNQYEQFAQQHGRQIQTGDDSSAKLGSNIQSALGGAPSASQGTPALQTQQQGQQQQQAQQQQQGYPPNFAPYGYPYHHYYGMPPYGQQQQGYPGYPSHHSPYAPYPGYGPPGGASTNRYPGQQQQQANGSQGGYRGGYGNASGSVGGAPHQSNYGSYASFDSSRNSAQGQTNNAQDTRNTSAKDVFGDRYFSGQY